MAWYERQTDDTDVVLATRVTVSRNVKGFSFPVKMNDGEKENVMGMIRQAAGGSDLTFIRTDETDDNAKKDLYEKYFVDKRFADSNDKKGILISGKDDGLCVLINDDDHIKINAYSSGGNVRGTFKRADDVAQIFEKNMDIAFSDKFGFLTSDIRNIGTALKVSFLIAAPGVEMTNNAFAVISERADKYDWQITPVMTGAGIKQNGLYIMTNIATLGVTEQEVLKRAESILKDMVTLERSCRDAIFKKKKLIVEDQYYRSYAVLRHARLMESTDALNFLNWLRLGLGRVGNDETGIDWKTVNYLTHRIRRDYSDTEDKGMRTPGKAQNRATKIREILKGDDER